MTDDSLRAALCFRVFSRPVAAAHCQLLTRGPVTHGILFCCTRLYSRRMLLITARQRIFYVGYSHAWARSTKHKKRDGRTQMAVSKWSKWLHVKNRFTVFCQNWMFLGVKILTFKNHREKFIGSTKIMQVHMFL